LDMSCCVARMNVPIFSLKIISGGSRKKLFYLAYLLHYRCTKFIFSQILPWTPMGELIMLPDPLVSWREGHPLLIGYYPRPYSPRQSMPAASRSRCLWQLDPLASRYIDNGSTPLVCMYPKACSVLARDAQAKLALIVAQCLSVHRSICVSVRDSLSHAYVCSIARREPHQLPACIITIQANTIN